MIYSPHVRTTTCLISYVMFMWWMQSRIYWIYSIMQFWHQGFLDTSQRIPEAPRTDPGGSKGRGSCVFKNLQSSRSCSVFKECRVLKSFFWEEEWRIFVVEKGENREGNDVGGGGRGEGGNTWEDTSKEMEKNMENIWWGRARGWGRQRCFWISTSR